MGNSTLDRLPRRDWLRIASAGLIGGSVCGWLPAFAAQAAQHPERRRACILLWMSGGPSQLDTFDPKPGHENGGPFQAIDTAVPGIQICEHLPQIARHMDRLALVRSMSTKEGDHTRATYYAHTGNLPQGPIRYPTLGSLVSKELGRDDADLPNFVSIAPNRLLNPQSVGAGYLGPQFAPLVVGDRGPQMRGDALSDDSLGVRNLRLPSGIATAEADARLRLLDSLDADFLSSHPAIPTASHRSAYEKAVRMMRSVGVQAFNLDEEPAALRDAYGRQPFGQGCLLARRLVERGVPFVEVSLNGVEGSDAIGWDTHTANFAQVERLCRVLDPAWGTLLTDLGDRGLLDTTLVVWMGEFGRTPGIVKDRTGRDHFPVAWSTVLGGGGIRGGQVIGRTSPDGMQVQDRPVSMSDWLATLFLALGIDPAGEHLSNVGRPIPLAPRDAQPLHEVLL